MKLISHKRRAIRTRIFSIALAILILEISVHPRTAVADESSDENFLEEFLADTPEEPINPLFRQAKIVQRRSLHREGHLILGIQPSMDVNFGPIANIGAGFNLGYAFSEQFEMQLLWIPYFFSIKKAVASQLAEMEFSDGGDPPDLNQAKKSTEYTGIIHWTPGYGKISFTDNQSYRYDMFFDLLFGYLKFQSSTSVKIGAGFGNSLYFSDKFALRYSLWGSYAATPDLKTGLSSPSIMGELQIGLIFYL